MIRTLLWLVAGVFLGGIIHIIVILTLPALAEDTVWSRVAALDAENRMVVLPRRGAGRSPIRSGSIPTSPMASASSNLPDGPAYMSGIMPDAFWSVALFNPQGIVTYSTTNRDGIGQTLELGIFNAAQTRLLAQQQLDIAEGLLVVESTSDELFVLIRLAPPHQAMRARFEQELSRIQCGTRD